MMREDRTWFYVQSCIGLMVDGSKTIIGRFQQPEILKHYFCVYAPDSLSSFIRIRMSQDATNHLPSDKHI